MIAGNDLQEVRVRDTLAQFGDSLLVVGERESVRVHVHTDDPGRALTYAGSLGRLRKVKIQDMVGAARGVRRRGSRNDAHPTAAPQVAAEGLPIGVVAAATGEGFAARSAASGRPWFRWPDHEPSTEQFSRRSRVVLKLRSSCCPTMATWC